MNHNWRVIIDESLPGIENMARDAALLHIAESTSQPTTVIRFYRWLIPTVSLGNKQDAAKSADLEFCRDHGIDIVRRPTGGGAVVHHHELTYSLVSNDREYFPSQNVIETYLLIAKALKKGLDLLGLQVEIANPVKNSKSPRENYITNPYPCFVTPSKYEILAKGKKIIGSAQKRLKKSFLQHGSIPYAYDWEIQGGAMKADPAILKKKMTCIGEHVSGQPKFKELVETFLQGFSDVFNFQFTPDTFTEEELEVSKELMDKFKVSY